MLHIHIIVEERPVKEEHTALVCFSNLPVSE